MGKRLMGKAVFLRHGESNYTDVFPDLTENGKETIRKSAVAIKAMRNRHFGRLSVVSSPSVRALGSASIVAYFLGFRAEIIKAPLIGPAKIKDREKGLALYNEYVSKGGMRGLSIAYGCDDRFEDGEVIEPRSQVRARFYKYLGMLTGSMLSNSGQFAVHISHYETLYHLVEDFFHPDYAKEQPLGFGEIILMSFYDIGSEDAVEIRLTFRGKSANNIVFNRKTESIAAGS